LLLHLAEDREHAPVSGSGRPILAHEGRRDVEEPQSAVALPKPAGGSHGNAFCDEALDEALPVGNLDVYQCPLIHESTPCFLSMIEENNSSALALVFRS